MRQRAEALARERASQSGEDSASLSPEENRKTLHELRVHQIQLELQNEELRRAQEEIEAARARYFDLYDLAPVGYCTLSEEGLILKSNLTLATLLGLARGALVKQPVSRFVLKEDQDICYLHRKQLFETGEPQEYELRLVRPDGAPFWAHLKGTAARAEDGAPLCRVIISDITERKRAADALRESAQANSLQAELLRNAPVIAAFHDLHNNIVWANRAYEEATGLSQNELVGKKCYAAWRLEGPCRGCPVLAAIDSGVTSEAELTPWNQSHWPESQGYWLLRAAPVRDENGTVIGAIEMAFDIRDRKRVEKALRQSDERHRITLESIGDGVISTDLEGRVALMNTVAEALTGWSTAEARGRPLDEVFCIVNEQTRATVESPVARVLREGQVVGLANHTLLINRQGGERPIADSGAPILDEQGQISGVVLVFRDQTEERRHLAALRESEVFARSTLDGLSAHIAIVDESGVIVAVNRAWRKFADENPPVRGKVCEGANYLEICDRAPSDAPEAAEFARAIRAVLQGSAEGFEMEYPCHSPDEQRWFVGRVTHFPDSTRPRVVVAHEDITKRKQADKALQESEEKFRKLVEGLKSEYFFYRHDTNGVFTYVSPSIAQVLGHQPEEFCVHFETFLTDAPVNREVARHTAQSVQGIQQAPYEVEIRHRDGSIRYLEVLESPAVDTDGKVVGVDGIAHDITERKRGAAERERLQASLAQSDRMASMGTLAAGVAHEINNPLSYVLYNVESVVEDLPRLADVVRRCHDALSRHLGPDEAARALGEQPDTGLAAAIDDVVDRLREAASGARRIKDIARGLGTFSRVDRDEVMPVQLQPVIEQALNMAFNQIKYRARVVKDYASIPPVLASDGKLAQVFLNLFINAAHAIDEGHVEANEIRVRTWAEGEAVFAEVSDTGKGIAPEHHDRIFQPFFTTKEVGVGSGLGLSIVRNIVTGFGGEISFSSEPGKGTRFVIRLPRLPRDWQTGKASTKEAAPRSSTTRGRILVADDERGIRAAIERMLGRDHQVVTAASGEEARAILEQDRRFDLIFCDLMMPRVSGMELHAWLAERDAELAAQVVFITGGAFTPGASEYLARVGNLRLEKPFDTAAFKKLTDELLLAATAKRAHGR
jgi:PAS domain S-box-containing protein